MTSDHLARVVYRLIESNVELCNSHDFSWPMSKIVEILAGTAYVKLKYFLNGSEKIHQKLGIKNGKIALNEFNEIQKCWSNLRTHEHVTHSIIK